MTILTLQTCVYAPLQICFDLSRSIDLHQLSMRQTNEKAVGGRTFGLIDVHEHVTWTARHFFVTYKMTVKIIEMEKPHFFKDEMIDGPFKFMSHTHLFFEKENRTVMKDIFQYKVPFGLIGKLFNYLILKRYMRNLLLQRNSMIRHVAESGDWKKFTNKK